jgi:ATP-binding cassette subfamily C (CFTR/MRP) protein 1
MFVMSIQLMVALLRIVELHAGLIKIDGIDIKSLGLKKLQSVIAVIPQNPVLFSGNVHTNLDPFGELNRELPHHIIGLNLETI